jgi:hypothetical protein
MLAICGQLFSDCWGVIAFILGIGVALAIYEAVTKTKTEDDEN